jgi:hypothetical protein
VIVFTASKRVYADRVLDLMGFKGVRLFREHCLFFQGAFLKGLLFTKKASFLESFRSLLMFWTLGFLFLFMLLFEQQIWKCWAVILGAR